MVNPACCLLSKACSMGKKAGKGAGKQPKLGIVEKQLNDIRRFRDEVLKKYKTGRILTWMYYYVVSPPVVVLLRTSSRLQGFLDRKVRPFLAKKCRVWVSRYRRNA